MDTLDIISIALAATYLVVAYMPTIWPAVGTFILISKRLRIIFGWHWTRLEATSEKAGHFVSFGIVFFIRKDSANTMPCNAFARWFRFHSVTTFTAAAFNVAVKGSIAVQTYSCQRMCFEQGQDSVKQSSICCYLTLVW